MTERSPIADLVAALRTDPEYRYGWQANLAVMMDDRDAHNTLSNDAASSFLDRLCDTGLVDHGPGSSKPRGFRGDLASLLNQHSKEQGSNTPDFILAQYLVDCLEAFDRATLDRYMRETHERAPALG